MRILHVYKTYHPDTVGGVEKMINQLAIATRAFGVDTHVLTISKNPASSPFTLDGHTIHQVKRTFQLASTDFSLAAFSHFKRLVKHSDIVHYHYPWPFMDLLHLTGRIQKPTVVTYHSDIVRQKFLSKLYAPLKRKFLNQVDKIVATSPNYLETSVDLAHYRDKTEVITIGLNKEKYPVPSYELLTHWQRLLPAKFFLFVGVLRYYKGLHILLDAAKKCRYPIVIAGAGPIENELQQQAKASGLSSIYFLGHVSEEDKAALFSLAYCIVFPSHLRSEAFGISLLEGAMYGKPLISSEIGTGTTYINVHQKTGLVIKGGCEQDLAMAMTFIWENPEVARDMGAEAMKRYYELFTARMMAERYYELYSRLAG